MRGESRLQLEYIYIYALHPEAIKYYEYINVLLTIWHTYLCRSLYCAVKILPDCNVK